MTDQEKLNKILELIETLPFDDGNEYWESGDSTDIFERGENTGRYNLGQQIKEIIIT